LRCQLLHRRVSLGSERRGVVRPRHGPSAWAQWVRVVHLGRLDCS
jgi:hypothetical protein